MIELTGKYNTAKVFTDNIDNTTISQVINLLNQDFVEGAKIRIMPDTHAGAGCVIGFTADLGEKVVANLIGVDIGCVDRDTEFLSEYGWVKISDYRGESVAVYDAERNTTFFESPLAYITLPETHFYHLKTKYGIDQMLSEEHTVLLEKGSHHRVGQRGVLYTISARELFEYHQDSKLGMRDSFIAEIPNLVRDTCLDLTDEQLRVQVMVMADGHLENKTSCQCRFKKERKISRAFELLDNAEIPYTFGTGNDGVSWFRFSPPMMEKRISAFYCASIEQLRVIADEIQHWDFDTTQSSFCSIHKEDADFVQYAFSALGFRTSISYDDRTGKESYRCLVSDSKPRVQLGGVPKTDIHIVESEDGLKYCFTTSTGFWIMRRNGRIAVTGNCGMAVVKLGKVDIDLAELDDVVHAVVPAGRNIHPVALTDFFLDDLFCVNDLKGFGNFTRAIGTLGGGNHFIEVNIDPETGEYYLVIHSGSRNLGKQVADIYQNMAIEECKGLGNLHQMEQDLIAMLKATGRANLIASELKVMRDAFHSTQPVYPKELCFLTGESREKYLYDMAICQDYASKNRWMMADRILNALLGVGVNEFETFETIHNYINFRDNIIRKGSVSAYAGENLIIPINMRDGSLLCVGKGNADWNFSAPHGAGRLMSRGEAKRRLSVVDFQATMEAEGIYTTTANESTLDEAPMAYKPMQEIIDNIGDTVEVMKVIKPVYNFKAGE